MAAALCGAVPAVAQSAGSSTANAPATEVQEAIVLSPFTVDASRDSGYQATSTLAGTRIRTNIGDIATSISVITPEFLQDTGATNVEDLLVYTTGTEVVGLGGNFSGGVAIGSGGVPSAGLNGPATETRLRGLAGADRTRGYFSSLLEFDTYNTERVEINRGANAALFGLGSPAGIINNTLKQALFSNQYEVEVRAASFGSFRTSVDLNQELIDNTLAVRLAALHEDRRYEQDGAFTDDQRLYGTATYQPRLFKAGSVAGRTTVRANFETGRWDENRPRIFPMNDGITMWFDPFDSSDFAGALFDPNAAPGSLRGVKPVWNGTTMGTGTAAGANRSLLWVQNPIYRHPVITYPDPTSATPGTPGGSSIGRQGIISGLPGVPGGTGIFVAPNQLGQAMNFVGHPDASFYANPVITDFSIFDFRGKLIDGPTKFENTRFDAVNVSLEQLFLDDKLGFEIAYDRQTREFDAERRLLGGSERSALHIDPNLVLMDGTPNPHFGRAFVADEGVEIHERAENENFRVTAFYELDLARDSKGWLQRMLGRHVFTGLYDDRESSFSRWQGVPLAVDDPWVGVYGLNNSRFDSNGRKVVTLHYLGGTLKDAASPAGAGLPAISARQVPTAATINNSTFRLNDFRDRTFRDVRLSADGLDNVIPSSASSTLDQVRSTALIWQSFLLNNLLVSTVSWREDELTSFNAGQPQPDPADATRFRVSGDVFSPRFDRTPYREKGEAVSYGVVAKVPPSWLKRTGFVGALSFRYNESENFQPVGARETIFGAPLLSPRGETRDLGFSIDLFESKVQVNATWYETQQSNVNAGGITNGQTIVFEHGRVLDSTRAGANTDLDGDGLPDIDTNGDGTIDIRYVAPPQALLDAFNFSNSPVNGAVTGGNNLIRNTQDFVAEGLEIEVVVNPTPNWRLALNVAQQETVVDNTARPIVEFLTNPTVMTLADGTRTSIIDAWSDPNKLGAFYNNESRASNLAQIANSLRGQIGFVQSQDGLSSQELREWRVNAVTNYKFREGRLRGVNVGGALRWEDAPAIGYQLKTGEAGNRLLDLTRPILGDNSTKVDFWVGYQRKLLRERIDWRVQLNLRNLFDTGDLVPVTANPDGTFPVYSLANGRTWELTSTFRF